ncbi:unnamed protein product [Timema podura]|uniref:Uncharacterized protein n=1 Tax=Timema podura TaxID=61482 RepID=A0ABN7P902_TIMPD|nr:unnamed protein product [Timema podura]
MDQDGNIRESRMRQYMLQTVSSDNWKKQLATDAIDTCIASGNRSVSRKDENGVEQCNPAAMDFLYCTWAETQLNCPSKYRLAGEQCDKVRKKLQKFTRSKRNL